MEMYTRREKSVKDLAYHFIGRVIGAISVIVRSSSARKGGTRGPSGPEREAEDARRCYKAQALAATWQGPRYFR